MTDDDLVHRTRMRIPHIWSDQRISDAPPSGRADGFPDPRRRGSPTGRSPDCLAPSHPWCACRSRLRRPPDYNGSGFGKRYTMDLNERRRLPRRAMDGRTRKCTAIRNAIPGAGIPTVVMSPTIPPRNSAPVGDVAREKVVDAIARLGAPSANVARGPRRRGPSSQWHLSVTTPARFSLRGRHAHWVCERGRPYANGRQERRRLSEGSV